MIGSTIYQPVNLTIIIPTITPNDVHTSVIRCLPSASRIKDFLFFPLYISVEPTPKFTIDAIKESSSPKSTFSIEIGLNIRGIALLNMLNAAIMISAPSAALEKYSALL